MEAEVAASDSPWTSGMGVLQVHEVEMQMMGESLLMGGTEKTVYRFVRRNL